MPFTSMPHFISTPQIEIYGCAEMDYFFMNYKITKRYLLIFFLCNEIVLERSGFLLYFLYNKKV